MSDDIVPFPVLPTAIVAVVVSLVLILESQNTEQQNKQVKHFTAMMVVSITGEKRTNEETDDDETGREKWKMMWWNS